MPCSLLTSRCQRREGTGITVDAHRPCEAHVYQRTGSSSAACPTDKNSSCCGRLRMTFASKDTRSPRAHENERASDRVSKNAGE